MHKNIFIFLENNLACEGLQQIMQISVLSVQADTKMDGYWNSCSNAFSWLPLTHWGRVTHICIGKLTIIASDNGLSPGRRQAIIWTNAGILLIGPQGTNFSEMLIEIHKFSFKKIHLKMSSGKRRPSCLGLNVLTHRGLKIFHIHF